MNAQVDVVQSFLVFLVDDDFDVFLGNVPFLQVLFDELASLVRRAVVDVHDVVVFVVLHEDRVEVSEIKTTFDVVV